MRFDSADDSEHHYPLSLVRSARPKVSRMHMFDEREDELFIALFVLVGSTMAAVLAAPLLAAGGLWWFGRAVVSAPLRLIPRSRGRVDEIEAAAAADQILEFSRSRATADQPSRDAAHNHRRAA